MQKPIEKDSVIHRLNHLYGYRTEWVYKELEQLLSTYQQKINDESNSLREKDVVLITYGDSFKKNEQPHLKSLKDFIDTFCLPEINNTHILPFYPFTSDDGFSVTDYFKVDPDLGTWDDILELSKSNYLMFDAVINHMSKSSQWFTSFLAKKERFEDFFIAVDPEEDLSKVVRPRALPLLTPFVDKDGKKIHVWTTFSEDQVDLNYTSAEVFLAVLEVLLFYISKGARLIRLDAIAFLWKKIGTTCLHLTETHTVIKLYKEIINSLIKNVVFITETNVPHEENISYFGNGYDEADMVYNFTLSPLLVYSIMKNNISVLTKWAQSLQLPSDDVCFFNFTASHDGIGVRPLQGIIPDKEIEQLADRALQHGGRVSYKNNSDGTQSPYELNCNYMDLLSGHDESDNLRVKKMMLTQSVMLAMPGIPGIYYHSLVGSQNDYKGVEESGINRRINREKFDLDQLSNEILDANTLRHKIFTSYKELLKIRTAEKAFYPFGKVEYSSENNDMTFIIKRSFNEEILYAVYNFSDKPVQLKSLSSTVLDLLSKESLNIDFWNIEAYGFKWLKEM